jgi:hypothetical protein
MQCPDGEEIQHCYTDFTCHPVQDTTAIIEDIFAQTQTCMMDEQLKKHDVKSLYISSSDSLRNRRIIQTIPQGWNDRPPLFNGKDQDSLLNTMSRRGIPPALRCAVWLSSVMKTCNAHQPSSYSEEYRTLAKVQQLDYAWESVLKQIFPNADDEQSAVAPNFGNFQYQQYIGGELPAYGQEALTRVLLALSHVVGLEYAPLLPPLAVITLSFTSESYAYSMLREMAHNSTLYFAVSPLEHVAWCRAFMDILSRLHPQTAASLKFARVEEPSGRFEGLDPIFKHFFTPIFKFVHVLRIMDIYVLEGSKVMFRFGVALLAMFQKDFKSIDSITPEQYWQQVKEYTHSRGFSMDTLVRKAYGYHGNRARRRMRFPRRHILARIIRLEQDRAASDDTLELLTTVQAARPMELVGNAGTLFASASVRSNLAEWLPLSLRLSKLELIYSTSIHGRTLERFYAHTKGHKHTLTVIQVLDNDAVVGMFASQAWRISSQVYGDGECFLFRASPEPACYKWRPKATSSVVLEDEDEEDENEANSVALLEQFQVGRPHFISMGGNPDGSCGLRLNEDLTRGESAPASGFGNEESLAGAGFASFQVGLVEVYRLKQLGESFSFDEGERSTY